jgi:hypothetical protein
MKSKPSGRVIPIYNSKGDWPALMVFPYVYSPVGEYVGWVTKDRQVYDVDGLYVGWLTEEPRILRKRTYDAPPARRPPPVPSAKILPPATVPLPPMMAEIPFELIDVLLEEPERLHTMDHGELKEDMD